MQLFQNLLLFDTFRKASRCAPSVCVLISKGRRWSVTNMSFMALIPAAVSESKAFCDCFPCGSLHHLLLRGNDTQSCIHVLKHHKCSKFHVFQLDRWLLHLHLLRSCFQCQYAWSAGRAFLDEPCHGRPCLLLLLIVLLPFNARSAEPLLLFPLFCSLTTPRQKAQNCLVCSREFKAVSAEVPAVL